MDPNKFLLKKTVGGKTVYVGRNNPGKNVITTRKLKMMSDDDLSEMFPLAWELSHFFNDVLQKAGNLNTTVAKGKTRVAAHDLCYVQMVKPQDIRDCILWSFSNARKQTWLYKIALNHLGSISTFYNFWKDNVKGKGKGKGSGRLDEYK